MCRVIQAQLPRSESSARQAARLVRATVEEWVPGVGPPVAEDAEQMTRALVTNAVVHALSPVRLVIALRGGVLEVGVSDTDATLPRSRVPAPREAGSRGWGRGLTLVDALSDEWGSTPLRVGKQVWFTLAVEAGSEREACACAADAPGAVRLGSGASVVAGAMAPEPT
jgi:anti-sigma regulatory factor (Ser/Thr protein kinase)